MISLEKGRYSVSNNQFKLTSANDFGFNAKRGELEYFNSDSNTHSLKAVLEKAGNLTIEIIKWTKNECIWNQVGTPKTNKISYSSGTLKADSNYLIELDGKAFKTLKSDPNGYLKFDLKARNDLSQIRIRLQ